MNRNIFRDNFKGLGVLTDFVREVVQLFGCMNNLSIQVPIDYAGIPPTANWNKGEGLVLDFSGAEGLAGGGGLPEGSGQYKVLQLDAFDEPVWDYVRAH